MLKPIFLITQIYFLMHSIHRFMEDILISQSVDGEDVGFLGCFAV